LIINKPVICFKKNILSKLN